MAYDINDIIVIDDSKNVIIGSGSTDPISPSNGTLWFNTSEGVLKGWNGTEWVILTET